MPFCGAEGKIPGVFQKGRSWKIPIGAVKPTDGRFKSTENLLDMIDRKEMELYTYRPLVEGEVTRLMILMFLHNTIHPCRTRVVWSKDRICF